jgi:5'-nucleotidase
MNILLTNDDGIESEGIRRLAAALSGIGSVYVCAPTGQRSASGHGITVSKTIGVTEADFPGVARAIAVDGTPADCVKIGIYILESEGIAIDKVFSGVNHGGNLGTDTLYSGTVAAAMEGVLNGKPSVAVSIDARAPVHFEAACLLAAKAARLPAGSHGGETMLNINTPDLPQGQIKGVRVTRLAIREYDEFFSEEAVDGEGRAYKYSGRPVLRRALHVNSDIAAHRDGYATITPLHYDMTDMSMLGDVRSWGFEGGI